VAAPTSVKTLYWTAAGTVAGSIAVVATLLTASSAGQTQSGSGNIQATGGSTVINGEVPSGSSVPYPHCMTQTRAQTRSDPTTYVFVPSSPPTDWFGPFECELSKNDSGYGVKRLQMSLNRCYGMRVDEDGRFGPLTQRALISVQRRVGTLADGAYGPKTRAKMLHLDDGATRSCVYVR
jgi:peptidoglycan hydrolase-like protein with peptidoglycan-binding domain